jgi:hypothetical protein
LVTAVVLAVGTLPAAGAAQELDTEFGVGGVLRTNFGGTYDWAYAVALQPDGKIVAAGVSDVSGSRGAHPLAVHPPQAAVKLSRVAVAFMS